MHAGGFAPKLLRIAAVITGLNTLGVACCGGVYLGLAGMVFAYRIWPMMMG